MNPRRKGCSSSSGLSHNVLWVNSRHTSSFRNDRAAGVPSSAFSTAVHTWRAEMVPNLRSADSRLVPGRSMRSRCSGYAAAASRRNRRSRSFAACSPPRRIAGLRSMPSCSQVGMTVARARTSLGTGGKLRGGGRGLPIIAVSRKLLANGLNTEYGLPAPVLRVPGGISVSPS